MKKIILILVFVLVLVIGVGSVSAKENTHIDVETGDNGYGIIVTLRDSSNNPIPD